MSDATDSTALATTGGDPLLRLAIDKNLDIEKLKELIALKREAEREQAERAFHDAMAEFQAECPVIAKNREATKVSGQGTERLYAYADLSQIARTVRPILARHGLSWTWSSEIVEGKMAVTCTVRHRDGHAQRATFLAVITGTSIMSDSQKAGAAMTFAQRYSLIQALGLTTAEDDTDGAPGSHGHHDAGGPTISEEQALTIDTLIKDTKANLTKFLDFFGVKSIRDLPASRHREAVGMLNAKNR